MLDSHKSSQSTQTIYSILKEITNDTDFAEFHAVVTAKVSGNIKIERQEINIRLTNNRPNYAFIDIDWENYGYINYKEMGLFGRMSTQYQEVKKNGLHQFKIIGDRYEITVNYSQCINS